MRNQAKISISVFLATTGTLALLGCKSLSSNEQGWLTPKPLNIASLREVPASVLGQAPSGKGAEPADPFSSTQYQPIQNAPSGAYGSPPSAYPVPAPQDAFSAAPLPANTPAASDPFLAATPISVASVPATPPYGSGQTHVPSAETPQQAAVAHRANDIPEPGLRPIHDPFTAVQAIPSQYDSPGANDPWGVGDPDSAIRNAVSIEEAAKKEEDMQERIRLEELASAKQKDGTPEYLKPMDKWNGPFETRQKQQSVEQDIIRQVGYVDVKKGYDNSPVYDWEKEEEKGFDWSVLDPVNFYTKVRDWVGLGPDEKKANEAMKKGREILVSTPDLKDGKKCLEAAKHFMEAAKRWPNSVLEEDALHLAGECYFFGDNYPKAMTAYQKLIINYQHSKHVDNAVRRLFRIARYWEKEAQRGTSFANMSYTDRTKPTFDTFGNAKKAYETIFMNDPNGPISDDAVMALACAYFDRGRYSGDTNYDQAAYYFRYLRENYPLSNHLVKAQELEIFARTNAYMGAEHCSTTLDEAGKLADQTLKQFGGELESETKEEIVAQKEEIINKKAEREWVTGQFYDKKSYFGAARLQYEKILDQYPQTPFAEKARVRLEQIRNKPDQPDQLHFIKKLYMPRGSI